MRIKFKKCFTTATKKTLSHRGVSVKEIHPCNAIYALMGAGVIRFRSTLSTAFQVNIVG